MSIRDGFPVIVHACLKHFRLNEDLLVGHSDPDALHQARVAMRRLRAAMSLFRPAIDDDDFPSPRDELRSITRGLGMARNLDVLLGSEMLPAERLRLEEVREAAYAEVVGLIQSQRFRDLSLKLFCWTETGDWRARKRARRPLPPFAMKRLDRLWSNVMRKASDIRKADDEARHSLRIDIKKLRYSTEFFANLYAGSHAMKSFSKNAQHLQESLGHLNDLVAARRLLREHPDEAEQQASADRENEERFLREAEDNLARLLKTGPFWQA